MKLTTEQEGAADEGASRLVHGESFMLSGPTGCGKTIVAATMVARSAHTSQFVLAVVPSKVGVVPCQWQSAFRSVLSPNLSIKIVYYHSRSERRRALLDDARHSFDFCVQTGRTLLCVVITTPQTLANDVAFLSAVPFSVLVVDEAHWIGSASTKTKPLKHLPALLTLKDAVSPKIVLITATVAKNSLMEAYSLLNLCGSGHAREAWEMVAKGQESPAWPTARRAFHSRVISVPAPPPRPTTRHVRTHGLEAWEVQALQEQLRKLISVARMLLGCIQALRVTNNPARVESLQEQLRKLKLSLMKELTATLEANQNPALLDKDALGRPPLSLSPSLTSEECRARKKVTEKARRVWWREAHRIVPVGSKFRCARELLEELLENQQRKVLLVSSFASVLDSILPVLETIGAPLMIRHGKAQGVHGARGKNALKAFVDSDVPAALLATRGSMNEGGPVVLVRLDQGFNAAEEEQLEGRTKRPLAQSGVDNWELFDVLTETSGEEPPSNIEQWLQGVQATKKRSIDALYEDAPAEEAEGITGTLVSLLETGKKMRL